MNPKTTWSLLALSLVLLAYIWLFERDSGERAGPAQEVARLFPNLDPAKVTSIDIQRTNLSLGVERLNERWQLTKPSYPAQSTGIDEFLQGVALLPKHASISASEISSQPGGRAAFGLQPAKASITVRSGTNRISFEIGAKTLGADQLYLQVMGDSGIYVTDARIMERLPASPQEWRNPMLVHEDRLVFDQIAVTNDVSVFRIVWDSTNRLWRLERPSDARADENTVANLIQQLRSARIGQFVTDDPHADLETYGLLAPKVQMTLASGTNPVFQLQIGQSPTHNPDFVFARRLSHSNIVLIAKEVVESLRKSHTDFRDRALLSFNESAVSRIEVKAKESFALQRQTNGAWFIVEPFSASADSGTVREFFGNLSRLVITNFERDVVTDFSAYGLSPPVRRYVLKTTATHALGATNLVLAQLEFGTNNLDKVFARRHDESSVYTVSYGDTLRLPLSAFEFRDRRIWSFASSNVMSVTVTQRGRNRKLERNVQRNWFAELVENEALEETLHRLGELRAVSWRAKEDEQMMQRFAEIDYQLSLDVRSSGKTQPHTIRFGPLAREGHIYAAVMLEEGQWVIFLFPGSLYQDVVKVLGVPQAGSP